MKEKVDYYNFKHSINWGDITDKHEAFQSTKSTTTFSWKGNN